MQNCNNFVDIAIAQHYICAVILDDGRGRCREGKVVRCICLYFYQCVYNLSEVT